MSKSRTANRVCTANTICNLFTYVVMKKVGGAGRDRTDDLKLAKLALSQLSYGPMFNRYRHKHTPQHQKVRGRIWWA